MPIHEVEEPALESASGEINFRVISRSGDDRLTWDRRFLNQIHEARKKFYELLDKGYKAYSVTRNGRRSEEIMLRFDPNAEEVIFSPMSVGG
jgi:hypothetical protein